jgi:hypothetical protein
MQHKQRQVMIAADAVDQQPRRGDGYALVRDDHEVEPVDEVHRLEQRIEAFLLAVQHRAEISVRTDDVEVGVGKPRLDDARLLACVEIVADLDRPAADVPLCGSRK